MAHKQSRTLVMVEHRRHDGGHRLQRAYGRLWQWATARAEPDTRKELSHASSGLVPRVSTRHQEQEATIESQLAQLLAYAEEKGYELPPEHQFIDQAISGQYLARPGLDRLRDTALAGAFEVLLCLSPDRLAHSLGAQQVVLDELRRVGVEVIFPWPGQAQPACLGG